ncbi:ATP-binding protein [Actinoplanes sp. NPDC048988]|uniref:HD domain-containing protein n=1 Tax=Actinoplanes sp. NPDC048988 TaxID=3363901 RepID=UPI0037211CD4
MGDWGPLGEVLETRASDRDRANVKNLVSYGHELLKLVRDTFPRYTLHDERHAGNVIRLMGRLAAPRLDRMTGLEAALLILAAYFHDAGMAYSKAEIAAIPDEDDFRTFLDAHDEAYVATQRNGGRPTDAVIEQYCRSRHADRVRVHLGRCDRGLLQWDGRPIIDQLELVCRSHNEPAAVLHEPRFRTDFLYQADLRFCAIMLRLADILDLDDTRAPQVIYHYLDLAAHTSPEATTSDREWHKHLAARGFDFPPSPRPNYTLQFSAESRDPGDEHHLRAFLKVIEDELLQCRTVVDVCDERWRGLPLPAEIDTSGISSVDYKYGEFRFELDRTAVLELFTGEQLYDDRYAFVRELLQNALDAIRAREHLYGHQSAGVQVWCWEDDGGYLWIRVEDDGLGMDEVTLRKYFLGVGRSFYRSTEFEAARVRSERANRPFGVIGRFGVGVLACFMAGDQVELSTRPANGGKAVRLSINRRDDYFVLQEQDRLGRPMPTPGGPAPAFLPKPGTHIAVRIDPNRAEIDLDGLRSKVPEYLFAPPVPVAVDGRPLNDRLERLINQSMLDRPRIVDIDANDLHIADGPHKEVISGRLRLAAVPLNITRDGGCPEVSGQMLVYRVVAADLTSSRGEALTELILLRQGKFSISGRVDLPESLLEGESERPSLVLSRSTKGVNTANRYLVPLCALPGGAVAADAERLRTWWGYNGIALPDSAALLPPLDSLDQLTVVVGQISLSGGLRPDLPVSRSTVSAAPFSIHSAIQLATRRALRAATVGDAEWCTALSGSSNLEISLSIPGESPTVAALELDGLLRQGAWNSEKLRLLDDRSVEDLHVAARTAKEPFVAFIPPQPAGTSADFPFSTTFSFEVVITAAVLHFFVDTEWIPGMTTENRAVLSVRSDSAPGRQEGADEFGPMFAVPFRGKPNLARAARMMNAHHPLTQWLLTNARDLKEHFPVLFRHVFRNATHLDDVEKMNTALARVARTGHVPPPPKAAFLRDEDGWWWSR